MEVFTVLGGFGQRKTKPNKANSKHVLSEVEWANIRQKCSIRLLAMELFELYQCYPVFARFVGRLADGGRAGAGYFGFGAGLKLPTGAWIVPFYGESRRAVAHVEIRRAAGWQIYGVNLAGSGEAVIVISDGHLIVVGHFSERQVLMEKL
jgi:hypothetical protein